MRALLACRLAKIKVRRGVASQAERRSAPVSLSFSWFVSLVWSVGASASGLVGACREADASMRHGGDAQAPVGALAATAKSRAPGWLYAADMVSGFSLEVVAGILA